jgi:dipeptidyl aminopeptidase/acylaminoacyl peptidase
MRKLLKISIMATALLGLSSCGGDGGNTQQANAPVIGKQDAKIEGGRMTPEALWALGRIGNVAISPDGEKIVYTVSYYSVSENASNSEIFVMNVDGSAKKQLTKSAARENGPRWTNDGRIAYLSAGQIWVMNADGTSAKQLTDYVGGIDDFEFSPDETKILFVSQVKSAKEVTDAYPDLPKANARIIDDLMYRHWDEWVETIPHPFIADFNNGKLENVKDMLEGEPYESPMKPFGGIEQLAWSADGKTIAYTCKKMQGKAYALSTNSDIYFYDLASGASKNRTEGMMGYDQNPTFSPDGKWLAWESMERDGYEADKIRLFVMNLETNEKINLSESIDQHAEGLAWTADSKSIYFVSSWHGYTDIYRADIADKSITNITKGEWDYVSVVPANDKLIAVRQSISKPNEIFSVDPATGEAVEISFENNDLLNKIEMGRVEERWITTTDNKKMLTWVIYPPHFDPNKKYPAILYCGGGPQSAISQFWSYRWNFQIMAANDYIVVAPNRRGVPGFGMEWLEQISGDYGGQNMKDYLSAIDEVAKEPFVNEKKLGAVGASYGGFSVYWLAGNHNKRFSAFIAHNGMFNFEQKFLTTEEVFFANWDLGGAYWEKDNKVAQKSYKASPHLFVDKWDTPILVVTGERDFRIPYLQGMAAFNAAQLLGVPSEMLVFPDENHWVLKPQNGVLWQRMFFGWLDKWLK